MRDLEAATYPDAFVLVLMEMVSFKSVAFIQHVFYVFCVCWSYVFNCCNHNV